MVCNGGIGGEIQMVCIGGGAGCVGGGGGGREGGVGIEIGGEEVYCTGVLDFVTRKIMFPLLFNNDT
jgi:hypothetical protein